MACHCRSVLSGGDNLTPELTPLDAGNNIGGVRCEAAQRARKTPTELKCGEKHFDSTSPPACVTLAVASEVGKENPATC